MELLGKYWERLQQWMLGSSATVAKNTEGGDLFEKSQCCQKKSYLHALPLQLELVSLHLQFIICVQMCRGG